MPPIVAVLACFPFTTSETRSVPPEELARKLSVRESTALTAPPLKMSLPRARLLPWRIGNSGGNHVSGHSTVAERHEGVEVEHCSAVPAARLGEFFGIP